MKTLSTTACCSGMQHVCSHVSKACQCSMTFAVFLPIEARDRKVPAIWFLSGLTCTHENALIKAGAQIWAARHGIALVYPDTSPRGDGIADHEDFDLGQGAGFYVDATQQPWAGNFRMHDYVSNELPELVASEFPIDSTAMGVTGHSMGGHGALTLAMNFPQLFRSVSAFAPIANPVGSDWGRKQFSAYLGPDESAWYRHDAAHLVREIGYPGEMLIDQGAADQFLDLLRPDELRNAMDKRGQPGRFRMQEGYDHSYFFVMSFMADHVAHHAAQLKSG